MTPRTCWQCPNKATNPEDAVIGVCDECNDKLQNSIVERANRGFELKTLIVSPQTYEALKEAYEDKPMQEAADRFAFEHARRKIPGTNRRFSRPDSNLLDALKRGFEAGYKYAKWRVETKVEEDE